MNNFKDSPDNLKDFLYFRKTLNDTEIGIYPVIFGWRIRVGKVNSFCYDLDYCAGNNPAVITAVYSMVLFIISSMMEEKGDIDFGLFPIQSIKPMANDADCFYKLLILSNHKGLQSPQVITREYLDEKRKLMMDSLFIIEKE